MTNDAAKRARNQRQCVFDFPFLHAEFVDVRRRSCVVRSRARGQRAFAALASARSPSSSKMRRHLGKPSRVRFSRIEIHKTYLCFRDRIAAGHRRSWRKVTRVEAPLEWNRAMVSELHFAVRHAIDELEAIA